ncbi:MAG: cation transporter [Paracoccaceae bacterium]
MTESDPTALRRTVLIVAGLNLAYFAVEFTVALRIGSVSLFADSVDFLEDAGINLLIVLALGLTLAARARVGMLLAAIMLAPAAAFLWTLWQKYLNPVPPEAVALSVVGLGAMLVNLTCAILLSRHRRSGGSLTRAAFLSARNDVASNIGIVIAGVLTAATLSVWPDVIVGLAIAAVNLDAAHEVWEAARGEHREATEEPRA